MSMSARLRPEALERLLEGDPSRRDDLAALVAAARAAGTSAELTGLPAAVAAFSTASARNPAPGGRTVVLGLPVPPARAPRRTRLTSFATRLAVAAAAGAAALGGVSLAATSDGNPVPASPAGTAVRSAAGAPVALPTHATARSGEDGTETDGNPDTAATDESTGSRPTTRRPAAVPVPSLRGLCQAWLSRPAGAGKAEASPAFEVLIRTAGGRDQVSAYCTTVIAPARAARPKHPHPRKAGATHVPGRPKDLPPVVGNGNRPDGLPLHPADRYRPTSLPSAVPARPWGR